MRAVLALLALVLLGCQGGREPAAADARHDEAAADSSPTLELLVDPVGELLQPYGLGYRVLTTYGPAGEAGLVQESYGVAVLPLLIDVDADPATGPGGADVAVQLQALSTAYALEVRRLPGGAPALPLRLEAEFSDPLQLLTGSAGTFFVMGYDGRASTAPERFREALLLTEVPESLLPGLQSATLEIEIAGAGASLTALGGRFREQGEVRSERLDIAVAMTPPPATTRVRALYGAALEQAQYELASSAASLLEVQLNLDEPPAEQQSLRIDRLDGAIRLRLEQDEGLRLSFESETGASRVDWRQQRGADSVDASLAPLPLWLEACLGDGDVCGSHGSGTQSSLSLYASEPVLLNYQSRRGDEQTLVENMALQALAVDFGASGSFRKGYVFFDTDDRPFAGRVRQEDPRRGFDLRFGADTRAEDRLVTWKNYIQIDRRDGRMRCPGGADLDLKIDGRFYDADFVVDTLCQ